MNGGEKETVESAPQKRRKRHRLDIGAEIIAARKARVPWKVLTGHYKLSRSRLYQLICQTEQRRCPSCGRCMSPGG